jgi:hypothetical protein
LTDCVHCSTEQRAVSATKERSWSYDGRKEEEIGSGLTEDLDDEGRCLHATSFLAVMLQRNVQQFC